MSRGSVVAVVDVGNGLTARMAPDRAGVEIVAGSPRALRSRLIRSVDRFLRRTDTWPAMTLARVSPRGGATYTTSNTKRMLDLAISLPAALFVILIVGILLAVNKLLYPADPALFVQDRVGGHEEPVRVLKIRSLVSAHGNSKRQTGTREVPRPFHC